MFNTGIYFFSLCKTVVYSWAMAGVYRALELPQPRDSSGVEVQCISKLYFKQVFSVKRKWTKNVFIVWKPIVPVMWDKYVKMAESLDELNDLAGLGESAEDPEQPELPPFPDNVVPPALPVPPVPVQNLNNKC